MSCLGCSTRIRTDATVQYVFDNISYAGMYVLRNGQIKDNSCEWQVWHDMSGMWVYCGKASIKKDGDILVINAPNEIIKNEITQICSKYPEKIEFMIP